MEKKSMTYKQMFCSISEIIGNLEEVHDTKLCCPTTDIADLLRTAYLRSCTLRGSVFEDNEDVDRNIRAAAKWMTDPSTKPWLLLWGRIGSGKSTLAEAISLVYKGLQTKHNILYNESVNLIASDEQFKCVTKLLKNVPEYVTINATDLCYFAENKPEEYAKMISVPLLIVDDIGTEPVYVKRYGTNTQPIVEMIYDRYDNVLATVITSNMDIDRIGRNYGERIKDRMREMCNVIEFKHESYRK